MKCPFCAEEILEQASVCRYCHRDLTFFKPVEDRLKPISERLESLEEHVAQLTKMIAEFAAARDNVRTSEEQQSSANLRVRSRWNSLRLSLWVVFASLLISTLPILAFNKIQPPPDLTLIERAYEIPSHVPTSAEREAQDKAFEPLQAYISQIERMSVWLIAFGIGFLLIPIFSGFLVGMKWSGSHLRSYLLLGLLLGLGEAIVIFLNLYWTTPITGIYLRACLTALPLIVIRAMLGFTSGALLGDWVERKIFPNRLREGFAEKLAARLIAHNSELRKEIGTSKISYADRVKVLANLITALAPILTLLGTLITAYFGYRAAIAAAENALRTLPK